MATITPYQGLNTGVTPIAWNSIAVGGDSLVNNGRTILILRERAGAGTTVVTADTPGLIDGLAVQNPTVTVPSGGATFAQMGPFDPSLFNTAAGIVALTYSGAGPATTDYIAISV